MAIIDFGTSELTVLIGSRGVNDIVNVDGIGICGYAGFVDGQWLDPGNLSSVIARAIDVAEGGARQKINKIYVGVPGDFLRCELNDVSMSIGNRRRITDKDVIDLHTRGNLFFNDENATVINIQPVYYTLDDERKLIEPVGMVSTKIGGCISYILADNDFIQLISSVMYDIGIREVEYIATPLAESLLLFDGYKRDRHCILADVGALSTTLSIARGDGLCRVFNFPWGGERITMALSDGLGISRQDAERLKHKVNLFLDPAFDPIKTRENRERLYEEHEPFEYGIMQNEYAVETNSTRITYPVAMTNSIVEHEIKRFAEYVAKTLYLCDYEYPKYTALSITGGGLIQIRGATEVVAQCLERDVEEAKPAQPLLNRPQMSSALGLMDMVLRSEAQYSGMSGKIRRLFSRR